jgi:hypothetical protein
MFWAVMTGRGVATRDTLQPATSLRKPTTMVLEAVSMYRMMFGGVNCSV